jgi:hypothetical protein
LKIELIGVLKPLPFLIGTTIYSITLIYLLKRENERSRRNNAERTQRQQLRNDLSAGLLPEGNYVVGDDGELVEAEDTQNDYKAQS